VSSDVPANVRDLLQRVDTFEKLELIVLLCKARAAVSVTELALRLKLGREVIRQAVSELRSVALVDLTSTDSVQLLPPTERDRDAVDELVKVYEEDRLAVVKVLGEIAMQRIRNMASQAFADAFVLRKKPRGEDDG
jgi:Mn-dependent DtxR family transcriptional regulator